MSSPAVLETSAEPVLPMFAAPILQKEEIMESKTRYKYAIVRLKEGDLKDFFNLLVSKGYFEVSFVGNLHQAMAKPDPNEEGENAPSTSTKNDDRSVQLADSEDRFSVVATPPEDATPPAPLKKQSPLDLFLNPKIEEMEQENEEAGAFLNGSTSSELLSHLFPSHGLNIEAWSNELQNMNGLNGLAAAIMPRHQVAALNNRHSPYKNIFHQQQKDMNQGAFQTRMKGWQREYIKDIINNGHYPTEDELKEIEQKCDLSRKQVLRFIAKRLVNPNRKQRADSVVRLSATTTPVKDGEGEGEGEEGFAGNESDTPDSSDVHH